MRIREFIQQTFRERVKKAGAMVLYDAAGSFREIVRELADDRCTVIDASKSFIEAHEKAVEWWAKAGDPKVGEKRLIVYVPAAVPKCDEERCHDPFSGIAAGSDWFPRSDEDTFQNLCERAKPEQKSKIRELFACGKPDISTLEAVGDGTSWPQLETALGAESTAEIIIALLCPSPDQEKKLKAAEGWFAEAKELLVSQLGFVPKTTSHKRDVLAVELWRFLLFSEFVCDLPDAVPASLLEVPTAAKGSEILVYRICDALRQEQYYASYIEHADNVAGELSLAERMRQVEDLGERDTFAFEERSFLFQFVRRLLAGDWKRASEIADARKKSVWVRHTDRGLLWTIADRARELLVAADDIERDSPVTVKSVDELVSFFTRRGYRLDQAHREMEKAVADAFGEIGELEELLSAARTRHRAVSEQLQHRFVDLVVKEGWPTAGRLRASQVFDRCVAPLLATRGNRVALFMVDALRYELAVAVERQVSASYTCRLKAACAQLPTTTAVGMAALLPKADGNLFLKRDGDDLAPTLHGKPIRTPQERFGYVQELFGDRAAMVDLDVLVMLSLNGKKKPAPFEGVELLLVKTTNIDEQGELDAINVCVALPHILAKLIAAVGKLKKLGFHHVVLSADHGFVLYSETGIGNTVAKPPGEWLEVKDRCLLGRGSASSETVLFSKEQVGISGDFESYVVPRSYGTFAKRHPYFHEGLSLQETTIPVLEIDLGNDAPVERPMLDVQIRYRGLTSGTITTRRPILDISVFGGELFGSEVVFRLEGRAVIDSGDVVVAEAASSPHVDAATGSVRVKAGQAVKVPLRVADDFFGALEVRAIDAETGLLYGAPLKLKVEVLV